MITVQQKLPRLKDFFGMYQKRRFSYADIDNFLVHEKHEQRLTNSEKMILLALARDHVLVKTYRRREKMCESLFQILEV